MLRAFVLCLVPSPVRAALVAAAVALGGCSTAHKISGPSGEPIVMVECGAGLSFSICYDRAAKEFPLDIYDEVEETGGDLIGYS
jgi:hypothetical protein